MSSGRKDFFFCNSQGGVLARQSIEKIRVHMLGRHALSGIRTKKLPICSYTATNGCSDYEPFEWVSVGDPSLGVTLFLQKKKSLLHAARTSRAGAQGSSSAADVPIPGVLARLTDPPDCWAKP